MTIYDNYPHGPITRIFTSDQIECLIRTAAETVHGNAIDDDTLSQRQISLSMRAYVAMMAEYDAAQEPTEIGPDALQQQVADLAQEIDN